MPRYEITGTATGVFRLADILDAIGKAGAQSIGRRRAYGLRNQPHVATFRAESDEEARRVCDTARAMLGEGSLPSLLPYRYQPSAEVE